jgi:hypothetical protein
VTFSDSDWTVAAAATTERKDRRVALALTAGIAIGALAASLLWWLAITARAPRPQPAPMATTVPLPEPAPVVAAVRAMPSSEEAGPSTQPDAASAPVATAAHAASATSTAALQAPLAEEAARRKERAWQKFYQRPTICTEDRRGEFLVECANHSIRARREFEERYANGRL